MAVVAVAVKEIAVQLTQDHQEVKVVAVKVVMALMLQKMVCQVNQVMVAAVAAVQIHHPLFMETEETVEMVV
jgi:hypothetical protein